MNNDYYYNYLKNSSCYQNLVSSQVIVKKLNSDIDDLLKVLLDAEGPIISQMIHDLNELKNKLSGISENAKELINDLKSNASVFDACLNLWKGKVNTVYKSHNSDLQQKIGYTTRVIYTIKDVIVDGTGHIVLKCEITSQTRDGTGKLVSCDNMGDYYETVQFV